MGFFDKFKGSNPVEVRVEKVEFAQLGPWVETHKKILNEGVDERSKALVQEIPEVLDLVQNKLNELDKAQIHKEVPQRVVAIVSSSKDNYIHKIKKVLDSIALDAKTIKLSDDLNEKIIELRKIDIQYGERVKYGFPKELDHVKKEFNHLVEMSDNLNSMLDTRKKKLKLLKDVEHELEKTNAIVEEINKLEERKGVAEKELAEATGEKTSKERGVDNIEHSERAEKLAGIELELEALELQKKDLENYVLNVLGPLKRVFKKYAKAIKDGKASGINVDKYAEDPVETYFWGEHTLPELLPKIIKAVQTGILDLDQNETDRALRKMRAISFAYLEKTRSEYNTIVGKMRSLEQRRNELSISNELSKMEREIGSLDSKIEDLEKRVEKLSTEIEESRFHFIESNSILSKKLSDFIGGRAELI